MAFFVGRDREARRAYGFDEIALVPGAVTVNPDEVEISITIGDVKLEVPFLASARRPPWSAGGRPASCVRRTRW